MIEEIDTDSTPHQSTRNAQLIIAARLVSDFGAFLNRVALATYVYMLGNSATSVGIFLACRVAGGVFASLIAAPFYNVWAPGALVLLFHGIPLSTLPVLRVLAVRGERARRSSPTPVP